MNPNKADKVVMKCGLGSPILKAPDFFDKEDVSSLLYWMDMPNTSLMITKGVAI